MSDDAFDGTPEIFIPEKYLTQKEVLVPLDNHGWGIRIRAPELGKYILEKRVSPQIIVNRDFIAIIHETAVDPNS